MTTSSHRYHDKWLWLTIPFFGVLYRHTGETASLTDLLKSPIYYLDLVTSMAVIGVLFVVTRAVIIGLDRKIPWETQTTLRVLLQAAMVYGFTIVFTVLVSFFYNEFFMTRPPEFNLAVVFVYDVPFAALMITIVQMAYGLLYMKSYYEQKLAASQGVATADTGSRKTILANSGKAKVPIAIGNIAFICKVGDFTAVQTFELKEYTIDESLDQVEEWLPQADFFRVSRQCIAQRKTIVAMTGDPTGKIILTLSPGPGEVVTVSKKKAQEFKFWLNQ